MTRVPDVLYTRSGSHDIAYQLFGSGPAAIVVAKPGPSQLEVMWEHPLVAEFLAGLGGFARVVVFDSRGFGLSSAVDPSEVGQWEAGVDDGVAVLAAVGWERATLVALGPASTAALLIASVRPQVVSSLVTINGMARLTQTDDYPWGGSPRVNAAAIDAIDDGRPFDADWRDDPRAPGWFAKLHRAAGPPTVWRHMFATADRFDVRAVLDTVRVPTLCIAARERGYDAVGAATDLAARIADAEVRSVDAEVSGGWLVFDPPSAVLAEIQRFVTGAPPPVVTNRVLAAVMFTDVVDSTATAAAAGDGAWRRTLDGLDATVTAQAQRYGGRVIKGTGDGHLLTFDGPSRAISAGLAIRDEASGLGLQLRTGVHIGEVELRGDDVAGMAVVIGRRVCDIADGGQILVSHAVPPLVIGGDVAFADRGPHELKGVPGEWTLHEVVV